VKETTIQHRIEQLVIYGAPGCSYCVRAKELANRHGIRVQYIDLSTDAEAKKFIIEDIGARTVPQIFHDGKHIGGYTELVKYLK
jgi:glutaredoxin